jgi:hypothetical protein
MGRVSDKSRAPISDDCVLAVYDQLGQAEEAIHILRRSGLETGKLSLVTRHPHAGNQAVTDVPAHDDSVRDAAIGAGVGGIVGALGGAAVVAAAGGALVLMAGPIGAAGITGALAGAFLGGLGGWGVHRERIAHYQEQVERGKTLVIVHGNPQQLVEAEQILKETDPLELHMYAKTGSESSEVNPEERLKA